jgi:broad specificity polyphosphatase/5'/3'-nucleotidase SurE
MTGEFLNLEPDNEKSDNNVVESGYVSVVAHKIDNTDYDEVNRLKSLWKI